MQTSLDWIQLLEMYIFLDLNCGHCDENYTPSVANITVACSARNSVCCFLLSNAAASNMWDKTCRSSRFIQIAERFCWRCSKIRNITSQNWITVIIAAQLRTTEMQLEGVSMFVFSGSVLCHILYLFWPMGAVIVSDHRLTCETLFSNHRMLLKMADVEANLTKHKK